MENERDRPIKAIAVKLQIVFIEIIWLHFIKGIKLNVMLWFLYVDGYIWFITYVGSDVAKKNLWEGGIMLRILKRIFNDYVEKSIDFKLL